MTLFPFMQLAGRGPDLPATVGTEEVGHRDLLRVQFPTGFPAIAREDMPTIIDRIELGQEGLLRLQNGLTPRDVLLAHDRLPLASEGTGERVGDDADHGGRTAFRTLLHEA